MSKLTLPDGATYVIAAAPDAAKSAMTDWDGETVAGVVIKSEADRRYTLTVGYPAYKPDKSVARDGFRDFASDQEVEKAAWNFMRNGSVMGAYHQDGTEGAGDCVESYVYRGPDWHITAADGSEQVIKSGTWLIGSIWDEPTWDKFKTGELGGTSMQGSTGRRVPDADTLAKVEA